MKVKLYSFLLSVLICGWVFELSLRLMLFCVFLAQYRALVPLYYKDAAAAVVVYDITNKVSHFSYCNIRFHQFFFFFKEMTYLSNVSSNVTFSVSLNQHSELVAVFWRHIKT
jgi:hypothetical protein